MAAAPALGAVTAIRSRLDSADLANGTSAVTSRIL